MRLGVRTRLEWESIHDLCQIRKEASDASPGRRVSTIPEGVSELRPGPGPIL
jgi:hypothetical protein